MEGHGGSLSGRSKPESEKTSSLDEGDDGAGRGRFVTNSAWPLRLAFGLCGETPKVVTEP
jgi:hypothetical protein